MIKSTSITRRVQGSPKRGQPMSPRRVQSPKRSGTFVTPGERKQMLQESLVLTGREQTNAGKKFCYGCNAVGHLRRDCPTNPWEGNREQNTNKKRTRQSPTGETPDGKVARITRVFEKPEFGPEQMKLILFSTEGDVTEERFQRFRELLDDWMIQIVDETEGEVEGSDLSLVPEIDKTRRYNDRIELTVPTFSDLQKLKELLTEVHEAGFKVLTPEEYELAKEKLTRFTGVIPVDPDKVTLEKLNSLVKIHCRLRKIEGRLEITKRFGKCRGGGIYELMVSDKALQKWTEHYIHIGTSGKIQFTMRSKTDGAENKAEAEKLEKEEQRLQKQLELVKTKKDKIAPKIAVDEAEGELIGMDLGGEGQGGEPGATDEHQAEAATSGYVKVEVGGDEFPSLPPPGEVPNRKSNVSDQPTPQAVVLGGSSSAEGLSKGTLPEGPQK